MLRITPCLMYEGQAEEAVDLYVAIFRDVFGDAEVLYTGYYTEAALAALEGFPEEQRPGPAGTVSTVRFQLAGQELLAANAGTGFGFSLGLSLYISCDTQEQIDQLWERLAEGGQELECGWVQDRYGVPWQIAPAALERMAEDPDTAKADRVMVAMLGMRKLDLAGLERAYRGE